MSSESFIEKIQQSVIEGSDSAAPQSVQAALDAGVDPLLILNEGLMAAADVVGKRFETGEYFLPQLMLTGRALKAAMAVLEPALKQVYADRPDMQQHGGVVVIATVHRDIHDIGKNMVSSMLTASGFDVHDMGVDVPIKSIIEKAEEVGADLIACSALLTTSMPLMRDLLELLKAMGLRDKYRVMVGGAPVTPEFAHDIGADGTAANAVQAARLAKTLVHTA